MQFNAFGSTPQGFEQVADLTAAVGLADIPAAAAGPAGFAVLLAETKNVRWRDDGNDPTASVGMLLIAGEPFVYQGDLSAIKFIEVEPTAALNVSYYSATGGLLKP